MRKGSIFLTFVMLISIVLPTFAFAANPIIAAKPISLTVVLKDQSISKSFKDFVVKSGGKIEKEIPQLGFLAVKGNPDLITTLQKNSLVRSVGPSLKMNLPEEKKVAFNPSQLSFPKNGTANQNNLPQPDLNPLYNKPSFEEGGIGDGGDEVYHDLYEQLQWDIKRVTNYGASFKENTGSHDVVIGIIDTGVDTGHPDLMANYMGGKNYVPANDNGDLTETGDTDDVMDRNGHGTYVAGAIAGNGRIMGVAPDIGFKSYRVFGENGGAETSTIAQAIVGATDDADNVDVISMSLGGYSVMGQIFYTDSSSGKKYNLGNEVADFLLYKRAIKYATDHGITVVAAAGNDNINITAKGKVTDFLNAEYGKDGYSFVGAGFEQPGLDPGVITVSATGPMDTRASYSNYGPGSIDVTAPGGDAQRYEKGLWYLDLCFGAYKGQDYIFMGGTSMATPKVAAVAGLLISKYGKVGPQKIAQLIRDSADDIGQQGKDQYFGNGMVQAPYQKEILQPGVEWHKQFGGALWEMGSKVHQTSDGGYIAVGASQTFSTAGVYFDQGLKIDYDLLVVKVGKDGRTEWYRPIGSDSLREWGNDVIQTKDGGYLVLGYSGKNDSQDKADVFLTKLSSAGEFQWENTIGQMGVDESGIKLLQAPDGGFVITGTVGTAGFDGKNDVYLLKIDDLGKKLWEKRYGGDASDTANSIKATQDGGYIIAGQTYSVQLGRKSDFYLVKVDGKGNLQWEKKFGNGDLIQDYLHDVIETTAGDFIVTGKSIKQEWGRGYFPEDVSRSYFAKISKTGDLIWEKYYGDVNHQQSAEGLAKSPDGNFVAVGWNMTDYYFDVALWKFDDNGNQIWEKSFGGPSDDVGMSIEATKDGGYSILGHTGSYTSGDFADMDMYLLKLNSSVND